MCNGCFPDDIIVCPCCKRDDEGYKLGESDSPFRAIGIGRFSCVCGEEFTVDPDEKGRAAIHS